MATLIAVYLGRTTVNRCDLKCYGAHTEVAACECICGGMNHGVGLARAEANTRASSNDWVARSRANGLEFDGVEVCMGAQAEPLF
ncbi:hypothetical protein [Actinomadura litoris]|uniref:hypothetical protein n=1 Tax=Actinomadura litoris TaxID=2678616 RepID=UPI001FA72122|nr:hypothetical protein [Actinomadura litoris]